MRKPTLIIVVLLVLGIILISSILHLGSFLVVENLQPSDAILVLAGDVNDKRYERGIELLRSGYGEEMFVDASDDFTLYGHTYADWARQFVAENSGDVRPRVHVCPIREDSTVAETKYVAKCLSHLPPGARILLVSSEYHTRRALSIFTARLPFYHWSVAAAVDNSQFGTRWWRHREWAKNAAREWQKLLWWELIERWF
jgi:hypothetical protein